MIMYFVHLFMYLFIYFLFICILTTRHIYKRQFTETLSKTSLRLRCICGVTLDTLPVIRHFETFRVS
jgi:hypothetical protein